MGICRGSIHGQSQVAFWGLELVLLYTCQHLKVDRCYASTNGLGMAWDTGNNYPGKKWYRKVSVVTGPQVRPCSEYRVPVDSWIGDMVAQV